MYFDVNRDFQYRSHRIVVRLEPETLGTQDTRALTIRQVYVNGRKCCAPAGIYVNPDSLDAGLRKYVDTLIEHGVLHSG